MQIKDFCINIKMAYYGLALECRNPFEKKEIEEMLKKHELRWVSGYIEPNKLYAYNIIGGKMKNVEACVRTFIKAHECRRHYGKTIFKTKIMCLLWVG